MKKQLSQTSKAKATKKAKTGRTKQSKFRTSSKRTISQISYFLTAHVSNLKDIFLTGTGESLSVSGNVTPKWYCAFFLEEITRSEEGASKIIRIGPSGLEYRTHLDKEYRKIGWSELEKLLSSADYD